MGFENGKAMGEIWWARLSFDTVRVDKLVVSDVLEGFVSIMRSSYAKACRATARFIGRAFQRRTILLKMMHNEGVSCSVNLRGTQK